MKTKVKRLSKRTLAMFLGVLMLITSLGIGSLITANAENASFAKGSVIYVDIGENWYNNYPNTSVPYCFFSYSSSDANNTSYQFDRQALTQVSGRIFSVTVPNRDYMRVVRFQRCNANSTSTVWDSVTTSKDAAGSNNMFKISGWNGDGGWSTYTPATEKTFYVYNDASWSNIYYYLYTGNESDGSWPGTQITSSNKIGTHNGKDVYEVTVTTNKSNIILNNGDGNGKQYPDDITLTDDTVYYTVSESGATPTTTAYSSFGLDKTIKYTLGSNVNKGSTFVTNGIDNNTSAKTGTITAYYNTNVALSVTYASNYEYDSSNSSLGGATASNGNKTFTFSSISSDKSITIKAKSSNTPLSAPTIKYNSSTSTPVNTTASKGSKARITWNSVTNAGSYQVFKDGVSQGTTTNLYYDIERGYSYGGTYTVKAIPSNTASYSTSDASNGIAFTFNRVALTAPTVNPDKSTILHNEKVTFTISGGATSGTLGTDYKYQRTDANGSSYSDVTGSSWTSGALANTTTTDVSDVFKFKTQAISTDYYTNSSETSKTITVKPAFGVDSGSSSTFAPGTATAMSYDSAKAAYYLNVTLTSTSNYYFRINQMDANPKWSGSWNGSYPNVNDVVVDGAKVAADNDVSGWNNRASLHYSGAAKKIIIWFDYANKKVWIEGNSTKYSVTITQPSATGSSIKVADATTSPQQFFDGDTVNYSVTAGTGNVITGVTINGNTTSVDRKSSYTGSFDISQNTTITATVVKQYSITKNDATGGSYTVKRGSTDVTTFIAGDSLTLTPSPSDHYDFTNFAVSGGKTATLTANPSTLDTTGATGNITITPTWTPKTYTTLTAVGKYSTDGTTYNTAMSTAPTIKATSGTYQTGVKVTAPDVSGFKFVEWYTDKGTFGNATDKETMFKPNDNGAQAVARYKKLFTITSSVDDTGKGAGTVTTDKTSVEAGGSYTITATAKSGSAIESVVVGTDNKGTNASTTISNVSDDQDVKVKFKSNITIRGNSTIGTNWDSGDQMTSNAAGTEFTKAYTNVAGSSSGTSYEFKLHNGSGYSDDSSATVTITGGASTGTMTTKAAAGVNWKLTLKQAANVTIKSDGTKITEIKVAPVNATKHTVTFKKADNVTITGQYEGTNFSTASADAVVQVYEGDDISFTVTPASGKYISSLTGATFTPVFSSTVSNYKISNVTADKTITPTAADKLSVKAVTNKSARGTVSVDKSTAAPGETITITVSPKNGVLKSLTCTYANGAVYTYNLTSNKWTKTTAATGNSTGAQAQRSVDGISTFAFRDKVSKLMTSATAKLFSGADTTYPMTLAENSAATINATFDAYSAESNYYYNGYDTNGNGLSGYYDKRMTEVMLNGVPYSYYEVSGRSGGDQLMTVSKKSSTGNTGYAYFTRPSNWGSGWSNSKAPYAYFFNDSGQVGANYPGTMMTFVTGTEHNFKIAIPDGATKVIFSDSESGGSGAQTVDITMTSTTSAYYLNGGYQDIDGTRKYEVTAWDSQPSDAGVQTTTTEYWYNASDRYYAYVNGFNESGSNWNSHNAGSHNTDNNRFAKPGINSSETYYIMVFYAGNTYTSGSGTLALTGAANHDVVMWTKELPSGDDENVKIYAKDGAIRSETSGVTYANIADTKIYAADGTTTVGTKHNGKITNQTYETYKAAKGDTIVIKTQIGATDSDTLPNAADLKAKYYVRGFCVNGEVSELLEWNADGLYTLTYKVPEDTEITKFEITPIYYLNDTEHNPIVTYRVTGFTDELKAVGAGKPGWGDTLYTYPFYGKLGGHNNAFGAYPGQPMVYYKGQYQIQIPQKSTAWEYDSENTIGASNLADVNNTAVSGVTMSNGYYDVVHRQIAGFGDNSASADHVQTYDYGDFYKIFNEKKPVDNIVFDFKYRTKKHNLTDIITTDTTASALESKYGTEGNGFEPLTNFHGRNVDLFGTPLSGAAADPEQTTPVYVVSTGGVIDNTSGVENIAGYYATEWVVYGNTSGETYQRISGGNKNSIPPEVLVLNDDDDTSFNTTTYPSADANHTLTDWKALYKALEAYRGKPVMISYEAADAQQGQGLYYTGTGGATRNDGRWLYSKNGENITSNIKIQYSNDNGANYTDLDTTSPQVTGLSAYFTNTGVEGEMTYATTINPDKTFDFEAKTTNANYKFVGWFMEDGTKITTDNASHTERSGSYTFVAKFMQVTTGQLILSHSVDTNATYKGAGTAKIGVVVKNGDDEVVRTYDLSTSDITLDDKIIKSDNSDYTIEVTLEATATGDDTYGITSLATPSGQDSTYFTAASTSTQGKTKTIVLNSFTVASLFSGTTQNVKNIIYHSYFNKTVFEYDVVFKYTGRLVDENNNRVTNTYRKAGELTAAEVKEYVSGTGTNNRTLSKDFLNNIVPYVKNQNETIEWNFDSMNRTFTYANNVFTLSNTVTNAYEATQTPDEETKYTITFDLPFEYDSTYGRANNIESMSKSEQTNFQVKVPFGKVCKNEYNKTHTSAGETQYDDTYVTAPKELIDGNTTKYFQYWSVKVGTKEVSRCYTTRFNFVAYDNYNIEPIFNETEPDSSDSTDISTSITYVDTTRNQWNNNGNGGQTLINNDDSNTASDLLFNDFVLSYSYKGKELSVEKPDGVDVGFVVQRLNKLETAQGAGGIDVNTDIEYYKTKYANTDDTNAIKTFINGGSAGNLTLNKIDVGCGNLDNKDRVQWYYSVSNARGWKGDFATGNYKTNYSYKRYVYRAYSYVKDSNNVVTLSDEPVYFTMYDVAKL
jgi:hypothetical protein